MVKVTGRTRDPAHLAAHLSYVTRNGQLAAEDRDGCTIEGRREVAELARDWSAAEMMDTRRRRDSPFSVGLILSMPAGTDPLMLRDAARAFAQEAFAVWHDYVLVLHTDTGHPHVHLTVRARSDDGVRLSPKKADLETWRQIFARALRERGVEAEATPRRARGVTRKAERGAIRRLRQRHEREGGAVGRVAREKLREAGLLAFGRTVEVRPWERQVSARQSEIRRIYLAQAKLLQLSRDPADQKLGAEVEAFVRSLRPPDTERLALARALRDANDRARLKERESGGTRDRGGGLRTGRSGAAVRLAAEPAALVGLPHHPAAQPRQRRHPAGRGPLQPSRQRDHPRAAPAPDQLGERGQRGLARAAASARG